MDYLPQPEKDTPAAESAAREAMHPAWRIVRDVSGGTLRLRECGRAYLPKFPAERTEAYELRKSQATLLNVFNKTVAGYVGLVFRKDPRLAEDNAPAVEELWENIDNAGTHGAVFLKEAFESAVRYGHAAILVEYPANTAADAATETALNLRPYWTLREANQIMNWRTAQENGRTILTQITFRELTREATGDFLETEVIRDRVYTRQNGIVAVQVWRETEDEKTNEVMITPEGEPVFLLSQTEIPVAIIYGCKTGLLTSQPPLLDLALVNIRHYQDYSDYRTGKQKAALIIPYAVKRVRPRPGEMTVETIPLGFDTFVDLDEGGAFGFAEPNGNALEAHRLALADTKQEMAWLGLAALMPDGAGATAKTATEVLMDGAESSSELATMARSLQDAAEAALGFTADYLGETGGSLQLGVAWQDLVLTVEQQRFYAEMQSGGTLSLETLWGILDRAHLLGEDFDAARERQQIAGVDIIPDLEQ